MEWLVFIVAAVMAGIAIFALLLLVGFAFLQLKLWEKIFLGDETYIPGTQETITRGGPKAATTGAEVPLDQFVPDAQKKLVLKFTETAEGHGVEEVEEGDRY